MVPPEKPSRRPPPGRTSKLGEKLEEQAREKIRDEDSKRKAFARGTKRFTEGK